MQVVLQRRGIYASKVINKRCFKLHHMVVSYHATCIVRICLRKHRPGCSGRRKKRLQCCHVVWQQNVSGAGGVCTPGRLECCAYIISKAFGAAGCLFAPHYNIETSSFVVRQVASGHRTWCPCDCVGHYMMNMSSELDDLSPGKED